MFTLVRYRSWLPPFVVVGRAMVRCRRLTGKLPVETFDGKIFFITYFFQTDCRRLFIVRVVEMYQTLTVKLNSGPMSSRVLTAVMTGVAASATKKLMFDSLWIRKQGRTTVSCEISRGIGSVKETESESTLREQPLRRRGRGWRSPPCCLQVFLLYCHCSEKEEKRLKTS